MEKDIAWAAGLLEGEGSFLTKTDYNSPIISCQMTDLDVLTKLQELFGGNIYNVTKRQDHWKQAWVWTITGSRAATIMEQLKPFLFSRREKAVDQVLTHWYDSCERRKQRTEIVDAAGKAYRNGKGSLRSIAKQFGLSYETVRRASQ